MFTGLIEEIGTIKSFTHQTLNINCTKIKNEAKIGDSVAINGVCLSVTEIFNNSLNFHVSPTTSKHTIFNYNEIKIGSLVNLERAMLINSRLDGHIVTGHVDAKTHIIALENDIENKIFEFYIPETLSPMIAAKGSIAVNGVSLTIVNRKSKSFIVNIIPQTLEKTNLHKLRISDIVHIEVDILARYTFNALKYINK